MFIANNTNLFFNATIQDHRLWTSLDEVNKNHSFLRHQHDYLLIRIIDVIFDIIFVKSTIPWSNNLEKFSDACLAETRYWCSGKKIELYDDHVTLIDETRKFINSIDKIKSFITAFFLFLPGICAKAWLWLINRDEINKRNFLIINYLNDAENFARRRTRVEYTDEEYRVRPRTFTPELDQNTLPYEIIEKILFNLENPDDFVAFAKTCKTHYRFTAQFYDDKLMRDRYPLMISQIMTKDALANLPRGTLPKKLHALFKMAKCFLDKNKQTSLHTSHIFAQNLSLKARSLLKTGSTQEIFENMRNHAIWSFQTRESLGLVIRLANVYFSCVKETSPTIIITKVQGKWMAIGLNISGAMQLFLNDMYFHPNNTPELKEYFTRLFKGEPCGGYFSYAWDENINIDYQVARAVLSLEEGKPTWNGGIPVLQLWRHNL